MKEITSHTYVNPKGRIYELLPYQESWKFRFEEESRFIKQLLSPQLVVQHIGSTSVEGMFAKSCIDILIVVSTIEEVDIYIKPLENIGYEYKSDIVMKQGRLFRKYKDGKAWINLHFFPEHHPHISEMIALRDYLRVHSDKVQEYSNLKKNLFSKFPDDYSSYRKYKDEYVSSLVKEIMNK